MNMNLQLEDRELLRSVIETLRLGESLLGEITDEIYTRKLPAAFNSSIGGHYRHCLDHFRNLLDAALSGDLNYDHRERGTIVDENLNLFHLSRRLAVTCKTSYSTSGSQSAASTVAREIMYAVAHAVHHYALIGVMGALMEVRMPSGFGVAPSTLKHKQEAARAA
jgi:hypothetical protein